MALLMRLLREKRAWHLGIYVDCNWWCEGDGPCRFETFCGAVGYVKFGINFSIFTTTLRLFVENRVIK